MDRNRAQVLCLRLDEKNEFGYKLDTLALKETANKPVFEDIKKADEERMSSEEFKQENDRDHRESKSKKDFSFEN